MISDLFSVWVAVLTRPSVQTFEAQRPSASRERTLIGVALAAIVSAVLAALLTLVVGTAVSSFTSGFPGAPVAVAVGPLAAARALVNTLVQTFVGFYLFAYVVQFVGKQLGGSGDFERQAYLISTYWVPINIASAVLAFVPCIGWLIALALFVYILFLTTYAIQAEQGLSTGKAVVTWLIAGIGTAIIMGVLSLITGGWL